MSKPSFSSLSCLFLLVISALLLLHESMSDSRSSTTTLSSEISLTISAISLNRSEISDLTPSLSVVSSVDLVEQFSISVLTEVS